MDFLTLDQIKAHLRIDGNESDEALTIYAEAAEQEAYNFMERSYDSLIVEFGKVPADIVLACLAHVATAYKYREDISDRKRGMSTTKLPYAWEAKLIKYKPTDRI